MMENVIVSVVRDFEMYFKCISGNSYTSDFKRIIIDNREKNESVPVCYNRFLDEVETTYDGWIVFCHEDLEFQEDISHMLLELNKAALHGVVGSRRSGFAGFGRQIIYGNKTEKKRICEAASYWRKKKYCKRYPSELTIEDLYYTQTLPLYHLSYRCKYKIVDNRTALRLSYDDIVSQYLSVIPMGFHRESTFEYIHNMFEHQI